MASTAARRGRLNFRALPIALKIALSLGLILLVSTLVTGGLIQDVVTSGQRDVVLGELAALSAGQADSVIQTLNAEIDALRRMTEDSAVQAEIKTAGASITPANRDVTFHPNARLQQLITTHRITRPQLDAVAVLDMQGYVLASAPMYTSTALPPSGSWEWFRAARDAEVGAVYVSGPIDDGLTGQRGVHIAVPIYDELVPGRFIGMTYAVWNMDNLPALAPTRNRETTVAQLDGTVLFTNAPVLRAELPGTLARLLEGSTAGSLIYQDPQNNEWLYGLSRIETLGGEDAASLGWTVTVSEPLSVTEANTAPLVRRLQIALAVSAGLATLLIAGVAFGMLVPLRRLTDAADQIRAGHLTTPIPVLPPDEVGRLSNVLRELVARLLGRLDLLDAAVRVSRAAVRSLEELEVLRHACESIVSAFGYPGARVYLIDRTMREARLVESAGAVNHRLSQDGHRLPVDERTHTGRALMLAEPQVGTAPAHDLPDVALPLVAGGRVLGALCITGSSGTGFGPEDLDMLSLVADQVGAALQNARLFAESAASAEEIEALNRRLTQQAWEGYVELAGALRHTPDPSEAWPEPPDLPADEFETVAVYEDAEGRAVMSAPLVVRGQPVGTLAVARPGGVGWTQDERLLLEAVAARLATLAEGIRLVEETSWRAEREQRVNQVAASLQSAIGVDDVLQTALDRLSAAMGAERISLRLGRPAGSGAENGHAPAPPSNGRGRTLPATGEESA